MQVSCFPNTIVANLTGYDSSCFETIAIVPDLHGGHLPLLKVIFRSNPEKSYLYRFNSEETSEQLFDDINEERISSYGRRYWSMLRSGQILEV